MTVHQLNTRRRPVGRPPAPDLHAAPASTDRLPWAALLVLALMGFLLIATETMPAGLLPQIAAGLGITEGTAGQLVSAYALGTVLATIPLVALTRGKRRKPVFVVAILGFLVANTITAVSADLVLSLGTRFLAGAFSGLVVIFTWMVAHNTVYTYIASYLRSARVPLSVDVALVTFGVAALAGIAITAALVDRALRRLVLVRIALFITAGVIFLVGQQSLVAVLVAIVLWGLAYGGAATQLQTAISEASGENADVANSMLGVSFNLAIFAAGVLGAILLSAYDGLALPPS
jgi:predicted MFS family arabinose efflux permease